VSKKKSTKRIKLIANPGSGKMEGNRLLEQVVRSLQGHGLELDIALARPNEEAIPIARQAVKDGYRTVVAIGGDDTIWAVMRGLAGSKVRLGIIPAGTENNTARSLGIPENDPEAACDLIASGPVRKVDYGEVRRGKGKKVGFFEIVTVGVAAALYPKVKKIPKGDLSRVKDALATVLRHPTRPKVYLTLDGESKVRVETALVTVSNLPEMGAHFLVAPDASVDDGLLDISVYPEFSKAQLAAYFAQVRDEGKADESKVQRYRASKLKIKTSPKMAVLADGVTLGKGTVSIRVRRRSLRVIAPEVGEGLEALPRQAVVETPAPAAPPAQVNGKAPAAQGARDASQR
jgi:diacylglycerol kinase (ATP)